MTSGSELRFHRGRDSSPIYQNAWEHHHQHNNGGGNANVAAARFVSPHRTSNTRRSSSTETNSVGGNNYPTSHHRNKAQSSSASASGSNPNARHSMDVGVTCRDALLMQQFNNDASSTAIHPRYHQCTGSANNVHQAPSQPDDSIIMSRIKKSLEQREEFLRGPVPPVQQHHQHQQSAKEFYSRPQKLLPPVWPPTADAAAADSQLQPSPSIVSKPKSKYFVNSLGKIHEDGGGKSVAETDLQSFQCSNNNNNVLQVVSMRAKQFESGKIDDKTDFYRSELARLSSKHNVPNVAVRKMEYEQKLCSDKKQSSIVPVQQQEIRDDSITSCSSCKYDVNT